MGRRLHLAKQKHQQNVFQRTPTEHSFHGHSWAPSSHLECDEQIKGWVLGWQCKSTLVNQVSVSYLSVGDLIGKLVETVSCSFSLMTRILLHEYLVVYLFSY